MTEEEARAWIVSHFDVSRETRLERFTSLIVDGSATQNLISAASIDQIWSRHIVDSAQLLPLACDDAGLWADIGTGAGFPGMVIAILTERPVMLIEPRRKRAEFLMHAIKVLGLGDRVSVHACRAEQVKAKAIVISARAVAAVPALFDAAIHLSTKKTLWLLPKGQAAAEEVAAARQTWHGTFHVEQSITDPRSMIVTAKGVARR